MGHNCMSYFYLKLYVSYAPMETDDFTLGLMMDCWVKIIYEADGRW